LAATNDLRSNYLLARLKPCSRLAMAGIDAMDGAQPYDIMMSTVICLSPDGSVSNIIAAAAKA
jgi:hypothetical protein